MRLINWLLAFLILVGATSLSGELRAAEDTSTAATARRILDRADVQGGLIVHLGCGDGRLTAALKANDRYLVQGLDRDAENVDMAQSWIVSQGLSGPVTVHRLDKDRLPYADNLVNLLVVQEAGDVPRAEMMRVLAPRGILLERHSGGWKKTVKPRPPEIDEWTHYLHDASGNAVSDDTVVGPPRHMQWVGGPTWGRGHEVLASMSVLVCSETRVFYIADEGAIASVNLPSRWSLIARDAFSGVLLWKKPIGKWEYRLRPFRSGPPQVHRRLVAGDDMVFVTLGYGAPLCALDAPSGEVKHIYANTDGTEEIIFKDGVLYVVIGDLEGQEKVDAAVRRGKPLPPIKRRIAAISAKSGEVLWEAAGQDIPELFALTLAVGAGHVFYQTTEAVVARDAATGKESWRTEHAAELKRRAWSSPTLVVCGDVVLSADQGKLDTSGTENDAPRGPVDWDVTFAGGGNPGYVAAYSADSGKLLWSKPCRQTYNAPPDLLVADDLLWTGKLTSAKAPGITEGIDPRTGVVGRTRPNDQAFFDAGMPHHRCYRNKATSKYLVLGRSGVEFINLETGEAEAHHWVRGTCQFGVVPCNGLLYAPPHSCACFIKAKLNGLNVLAPARTDDEKTSVAAIVPGIRLERGPAFEAVKSESAPVREENDDWPTLRRDAARSGVAASAVPTDLICRWQIDLGGKLTSAVLAEGTLLTSRIDTHTLYALDADSGRRLWTFTAGGRIDSPPTIWSDRALFGCADGWVYCVRMTDGELIWRCRVAPEDRQVVSYDRLESACPTSGSVLVLDGTVYCAVGRSIFLDGGLRLCRIDAASGEFLGETVLSGYDPETGVTRERYQRAKGFEIPGALPDVLSSDGQHIFMRHVAFDLEGNRIEKPIPHLFNPIGFLDDTWWHRGYFIWGTDFDAGWGGWWHAGNRVPAGRILVTTDNEVFGFGRNFMPPGNAGQWNIGEYYHFFAASKRLTEEQRGTKAPKKSIVPFRWSKKADFEARALVLADDTLFAAGPRGNTHLSEAAFEGKQGSILRAISTADGKTLTEMPLESLPRFDGLIAVGGRLYMVTADGGVECFGEKDADGR